MDRGEVAQIVEGRRTGGFDGRLCGQLSGAKRSS
jgi:hypothetical protein